MNWPLLLIVSAIYAWVAVNYLMAERFGMGLAFVAYAIANLGFMIDLLEHQP